MEFEVIKSGINPLESDLQKVTEESNGTMCQCDIDIYQCEDDKEDKN